MTKSLLDVTWLLICAALVFLMQAGFMCLESGLTRSKNNINVAIKNLTDFVISVLLFWAVGFALMFGQSWNGWIGASEWFMRISLKDEWFNAFFLFQAMFCATAATIISGAVAERMRFSGYIIITIITSAIIYPVFGHWVWGGAQSELLTGWLGHIGFIDFAGSTVVHSIGGWIALAAIVVTGPREGRFLPDGTVRKINGNNLPFSVLGVILLWLGWFGFNGGSTLIMNTQVSSIIINTVLAGSAGAVCALAVGWKLSGIPDINFLINGSLAGLVAVTAPCHMVNEVSAVIIGGIGGIVMLTVEYLLEHFKTDDSVGAIPVHLGAGIWGTLAVALFGKQDMLTEGSRLVQFQIQLIGVVCCFLWAFGICYLLIRTINRFFPFRVTAEDEHIGLNVSEHGAATELLDMLTVMETQEKTGDMALRLPVEPNFIEGFS